MTFRKEIAMFRKSICAAALASAATLCPSSGHAVMAVCNFNVDSVSVPPDGNVFANLSVSGGSGGLQYVGLCNLNTSTDNITPATCKGMHTTLLMAKAMSRPIRMWFDSPVAFPCTCLSWTALRPSGWYWGPELL
jgi:hypothetical protein